MKIYEHIRDKQVRWALNRGLELTGSKEERGVRAYTPTLNDNLFEPLLPSVIENFSKGDGRETNDLPGSPAKMRAVHSTSALTVNVFQYWLRVQDIPTIASACGFCSEEDRFSESIVFEEKFPIYDASVTTPNLDVVIHNSTSAPQSVYAIECKFTEPFGWDHKGLKEKYLQLPEIWQEIPQIHALAKQISPSDAVFAHLDATQLIRHILGLKKKFGKNRFRLLYLFYDVSGSEGTLYRNEIEKFTQITQSDNINFHFLTYQELIAGFVSIRSEHARYVDYLTERYL